MRPLSPHPSSPTGLSHNSVRQGPVLDPSRAYTGGLGACWPSWRCRSRETFLGRALLSLALPLPPLTAGPPLPTQLRPLKVPARLDSWVLPGARQILRPQPGQEGPSESTPWGSPACPC